MHRGSRKHMLDWIDAPAFPAELEALLAPVAISFSLDSPHMPRGSHAPGEARLEEWGPNAWGSPEIWRGIRAWWLASEARANTPNWDFAAIVQVEGQRGILLVEAKANVPELAAGRQKATPSGSAASQANDVRIRAALKEASLGLQQWCPDIRLSADDGYQLSNRIAFAWKLASLGIPTVLLYLGFCGDQGIRDVGEPYANDPHWQGEVRSHLTKLGAQPLLEQRVECAAPMWLAIRSRAVRDSSSVKTELA